MDNVLPVDGLIGQPTVFSKCPTGVVGVFPTDAALATNRLTLAVSLHVFFSMSLLVGGEVAVTAGDMVEKEEVVQACLNETERLIGDLSQPNTGIFTYWPVTEIRGIHKNYNK